MEALVAYRGSDADAHAAALACVEARCAPDLLERDPEPEVSAAAKAGPSFPLAAALGASLVGGAAVQRAARGRRPGAAVVALA